MNQARKKSCICGLLLAVVMLCILVGPNAVLADGEDWPQFHKDAANSGFTASDAPDTNNLKWVSDSISAIPASSLAVGNGLVFAVTETGVTCLDADDGTTQWTHAIDDTGFLGSWAGPAYHDGKVFMSTDGIYCLDAADGHEIWSYPFPSGLSAVDGSVLVADGMVIAGDWETGGAGSSYYCLNEADGEYLWQYDVPGYAQGTPAYHDGNFFLTSWEYVGGHVFCVSATDGDSVWHADGIADGTYDYDTCGSVCVADGKVFFTTYNFSSYGELMALNESDGTVAWGPVTIERTDSTPAYDNGYLYLCGGCVGYSNQGERTYCYDASNGDLVWRTPVGSETGALDVGNWTCSVAVADGKVFVGKPSGGSDPMMFDYAAIYALDTATGEEVWHYDAGGASPAVAGGVVYTVGGGYVWAFEDTVYPAWDVNQDGNINVFDMGLVGVHFGETGVDGWIPEDVNSDGSINVFDMGIIGVHFGE